jgi:hypothetical protein
MTGVWTVARQTFWQCVRTKVAAVFAVLLAVSLALLPSVMEGDGTLAGRIRTFLDYGTTAISVLLAMVVAFLSVGVVSNDVRDRHVFLVCTKPLSRWQYIVGRWLGVVLLAGLLLGGAGASVYGVAQYMRGRTDLAFNAEDRRAVETEVFTARTEVLADPLDVKEAVARRIEQLKNSGEWEPAVETYRLKRGLTDIQAAEEFVGDMTQSELAERQSAGPGKALKWTFSNVRVRGEGLRRPGVVRDISREVGLVTVETFEDALSHLLIYGPVSVDGVTGRVVGIWKNGFRVLFSLEEMRGQQLVDLARGREVEVVAEPTIQISYRLKGEGGKLAWQVENPTTGFIHYEPPREVALNTPMTVIAPSRVVDGQGRLQARMINHAPVSVTVLNRDVAVLHQVGSFEANFAKTIVLMLAGLAFLAALGIFAGSWLSFPVGCLVCFVTVWVAVAFRFLTEAIGYGLELPGYTDFVWLYWVGYAILSVMKVLMPDLASMLATTFVVDGLEITWGYFAEAAALMVGVRGAILLAMACWVFHRRELARVQV